MLDLSNYTGAPLNALAMDFIRALEAERFTIAATPQGPVPGVRKTLRICWDGVFVALMNTDLWGGDEPFVCSYRFEKVGAPRKGVAHIPLGFDKLEFARRHGCSPQQLHVHNDEDKSYLRVRDVQTAMLLLRARASRINAA